MALWRYCFADTEQFVQYYFNRRYETENTIVLTEAGRLEAALQLNPYNLAIGDIVTQVSYVVGVSVQPESRGRGLMKRLIRGTLKAQFERGEAFSLLMPIDTRIYTQYGYQNCFERHEFHVSLDRLEPKRSNYRIRRFDLEYPENQERDLHVLNELYFDAMHDKFSYICRNKTYWKNKLSELAVDGGELFIVQGEFEAKGYVMLAKGEQNTLNVLELVALDQEAFHSLIGLIKSHRTQASKAVIVAPQYEALSSYIEHDNQVQHIVRPFMMGRVINAEQILDHILYKSKFLDADPECFCITVTDPDISENNLTLTYEPEHGAEFAHGRLQQERYAQHLKLSVSELAQLYLKSVSLRHLRLLGRVSVRESDVDFFCKLFGEELCQNYVNDYI